MSTELLAMADSHLEPVHRLVTGAGWPHRVADIAFALALSEGRVAVRDGTVVGAALMTAHDEAHARVSTIIVAPALRGQGLGRALTEWALDAAGPRACTLVATEMGRPVYERLGFVGLGPIHQHQGPVQASTPSPPAGPATAIRWASPTDLPTAHSLDRAATGIDRARLIAAIFAAGPAAIAHRDGQPRGFAAIRPFGRGEVVGPVIAADQPAAEALLAFIFAHRPNQFLRVDTPSPALRPFLAAYGLAAVDDGLAMRRGPAPPASGAASVFALASQALG